MDSQVPDDLSLLDEMMSDLRSCDKFYQPTNYWSFYEKSFMPELKKKGLKEFRHRRNSVLTSFGATDLSSSGELRFKGSFRGRFRIERFLNRLLRTNPLVSLKVSDFEESWVTQYFYWHVKEKFNQVGLNLRDCPTSAFGNPEDMLEIEGKLWSRSHLQYCSMFADAAKFIEFPAVGTFCELGSGMGRNIEVLGHLFPQATLLLFDIPPQLYVANQYLQAVFGSRVIGYREAKTLTPIGDTLERIKAKIIVLPTWRMPDWSAAKIDVFWNSASFQEMEPDVVQNYLDLVVKMRPRYIYINAKPAGEYLAGRKQGGGGTKTAVLDNNYFDGLRDSYALRCTYDTDYFIRQKDYKSYVFEKALNGAVDFSNQGNSRISQDLHGRANEGSQFEESDLPRNASNGN